MRKTALGVVFLWVAMICPCTAQRMSGPQYRTYLKELDVAAERWQKLVHSIDIDKMKVDYSTGKAIEKSRDATLENLKLIHGFIEQQDPLEALSVDILLEDCLGDASEPLTVLLEMVPANQEALSALFSMRSEMTALQLKLRKHALALADMLELKAASCPK